MLFVHTIIPPLAGLLSMVVLGMDFLHPLTVDDVSAVKITD